MSQFPPIAIVGQGCVLPGALTPQALWDIVSQGDDAIGQVPDDYWGVAANEVMTDADDPEPDATWSDRGGFVRGFEAVFDPQDYELQSASLEGLDPVFQWPLYAGRQAVLSAGYDPRRWTIDRGGVILGNKSYPTHSLADYADNIWRRQNGLEPGPAVDPRNRFMSGMPAQIMARALGLEGQSFGLDVACASSLYAIKLACDRLHRDQADVMIAGGVNRADDLFLRVGFCALQAMSRSGQSRPFHRDADGLVPAEGAAVVVLKRLDDAVADGDPIRGVIRGVGLSNDGRSRGLLTPSESGQVRCMKQAYEQAGLRPRDLSLVECHAAGTALGDATEVRSMARVFEGADRRLPIASLKSNLGHLITVSGAAGLLKVLAAMEHEVRPPTLHLDDPIEVLDDSPFRPLLEAEPWICEGPRRAAINNFGFGGNNAHLIVEQWAPTADSVPVKIDVQPRSEEPVAVVDMSVVAADGRDCRDFSRALFHDESRLGPGDDGDEGRAEEIILDVADVRFPPNDLRQALPQQLMILEAALQLSTTIEALPGDDTGILLGMQCDAEIARYLVRWRLGRQCSGGDKDQRDGLIQALEAAGVLGSMPNLVTNRLNSQFNKGGASLTISAEEISGLVALDLACQALRHREMDAAVVGAVDLSCEPVHRRAAASVLPEHRHRAGDAAVILVLKRLDDARRDGDEILALLPEDQEVTSSESIWDVPELGPLFGHAHAASGLLQVAAAVTACAKKARPAVGGQPPVPWLPDRGRRVASVSMETVAGDEAKALVEAKPGSPQSAFVEQEPPRLVVYSGTDLNSVRAGLKARRSDEQGPIRLAITARGQEQWARRHEVAQKALDALDMAPAFERLARGVYLGNGSLDGDTSFVFTGPAGSYNGMGRQLVLAMPALADAFADRCRAVDRAAGWIYRRPTDQPPGPGKKLWGASFLCQIHARLTRDILGIEPEAAIGFCAGETNALFAMGAWNDFDGLYEDLEREGIFDRRLGGEFETVRAAFDIDKGAAVNWQTWRVLAPLEVVEEAVEGESQAYITIVNAPGDCVVGGTEQACQRVIEKVGQKRVRPLGYNIAMHCEATRPVKSLWYDMHHRPTEPVPGVRFYTHATLDHYEVDADKVAKALVGQALGRVDFPKLIRQAWDDGVRVFIEHGPRAGCTRWIGRILGDRPHVAVSLDRTGRDSLTQAVDGAAQLCAAGLDVDIKRLMQVLEDATPLPTFPARQREKSPTAMRFPAHLRPVKFPSQPVQKGHQEASHGASSTASPLEDNGEVQAMVPAPVLPAVFAPIPPLLDRPVGGEEIRHRPSAAARDGSPIERRDQSAHTMSVRSPQAEMAVAHRAFLQERASVHRDYMAQQQQRAQWFLQMYKEGRAVPTAEGIDDGHVWNGRSSASGAGDWEGATDTATRAQPDTGPRGPRFERREIEIHASGQISEIFGPQFEPQDGFKRQVRMPQPPLLLVDRVTGIDAEPGAMESQGTIWTETDVGADDWYLHRGRMPVGITVEAGQADLMLISWMGADAQNRGQRVYRLLGCELTFHGPLPEPGETLAYEIHIDEHARQGEVRIFFFHYDCYVDGELRLSMRDGQAGFFSDEELANSEGVLWTPDDMDDEVQAMPDPVVTPNRRQFNASRLKAFADGRIHDCFGDGYERTASHTDTPTIQSDKMRFLDEIEVFDVDGGPRKRGYLRAVQYLSGDSWFFDGHFKGDPCMPGTLMLEGCVQAMSFYMVGLGQTLDRDGWRFEPVANHPCEMRCRGQVTRRSRKVVYELFVRHVDDGPKPVLYADLLCTVDGLKAFHCQRLGLQLVPDWPLERHPEWVDDQIQKNEHRERAPARVDGFRYDQAALMACALGRPSKAFGPMYRPFDGPRRAPRLPNPPYLFISRIADIEAPKGAMEKGSTVVAEYDVPSDAWYFEATNSGAMPFGVLMEVGLQPCGWLASYVGCALSTDEELFFRNLDGTATVFGKVTPQTSWLRTEATMTSISRSGSMIIVGFEVEISADAGPLFSMDTVFGFFPAQALAQQDGLATGEGERKRLHEPCDAAVEPTLEGLGESLSMIDEITGWWPEGGEAGLGRIRSEQLVDPGAWYFGAHFFQDPVQPGSLGVEGMVQLLQIYMRAADLDRGLQHPQFEPVLSDRATTWTYRGQVVPENKRVMIDMEITERSDADARQPWAVAKASLWVDGTRIYEVQQLGMQLREGPSDRLAGQSDEYRQRQILDPEVDTWLKDHRPTFTRPALPMMGIADMIARRGRGVAKQRVVEIRDLELHRWAVVDGPTAFESTADIVAGHVEVGLEIDGAKLATATVLCAPDWPEAPAPMAPLESSTPIDDPYESGALFHGPAFQLMDAAFGGEAGARAILKAEAKEVPIGEIHPALLDASLHAIPHDDLQQWADQVPSQTVAYPHRIDRLRFYGPTPTDGQVQVEIRLVGFADSKRLPVFDIQLRHRDSVWAQLRLVEALFAKGRIAQGDPRPRRAFLRDRQFVPAFGISLFHGDKTQVTAREFRRNDWFEGMIADVYEVDGDLVEQTRQVGIKDHLAQRLEVHPSQIEVRGDCGYCEKWPEREFPVTVIYDGKMGFLIESDD